MHLLHVGPMSPHVHQFIRLVDKLAGPWVTQEFCLAAEDPVRNPDLVMVHQGNELGREILRWAEQDIPVVTRLFNTRWLMGEDADLRLHCVSHARLVLGWPCAPPAELAGPSYRMMYPLVPGAIFRPLELQRDVPFFIPRITARDAGNLYWTEELLQVLPPTKASYANGFLPPTTMASYYNRARVVVCTGLDPYISNSALEAALCGAVPVLADTAANRAEFPTGARFCEQSTASILRACAEVTELSRDAESFRLESERNQAHFAGWAVEKHGFHLVSDVVAIGGCCLPERTAEALQQFLEREQRTWGEEHPNTEKAREMVATRRRELGLGIWS